MPTPTPAPDYVPHKRRVWGKKLSPMELSSVLRDYDNGMSTVQLRDKYGVGKSTLYRWIKEFEETEERVHDKTFMRARITDLEHCIAMLTLKLAAMEKTDDTVRDSLPLCDPNHARRAENSAV